MLNSFLKARGVSYPFQGGAHAFFALVVLLPFVAHAKQISVSPLPVSPYADTEVSTSARECRFSALICRLPEIIFPKPFWQILTEFLFLRISPQPFPYGFISQSGT